MAGERSTNDRVDQSQSAPKGAQTDENAQLQTPGNLELLRDHRKWTPAQPVCLCHQPAPIQMAQSQEPETELHLGQLQSAAQTLPNAATPDRGKTAGQNALPAGLGTLPTDRRIR